MASKKVLKTKPRIAFVSTCWGQNEYRKINNKPGAVGQYRLIHAMRVLKDDYDITFWGSDFTKAAEGVSPEAFYSKFFADYDLIISKITDNPGAASSFAFFSQHTGVPMIVDIDDNIWEVKTDQPGHKHYFKGSQKLGVASTFLSYATEIFASTEPLAKYVKDRIKATHNIDMTVTVLPNTIDVADYDFKPANKSKKKTVIGWQGSTTHFNDLKVAMPAINKLLKEYPNLYLELMGGVENERIAELLENTDEEVLSKIRTISGVPAFDGFPHLLSEQQWDIGIAPLTDDVFNHAKSHIKWMEYAMYEIPCVASNVYPYSMPIDGVDVMIDGENGYLANADEWYAKLKELIDNKDKRIKMGKNAKAYVLEKWNTQTQAEKYKVAIDRVLAKAK